MHKEITVRKVHKEITAHKVHKETTARKAALRFSKLIKLHLKRWSRNITMSVE